MKPLACILILALAANSFAAVRGDEAAYVGGTVSTLKQGTEGILDTGDSTALRFTHKGGVYSLPYNQIVSLEFGQKIGRRVGGAMAGVMLIGLIPGLIILSSKKKKHYLTIGFRNEASEGQAAVFELAKGTVSHILPSIEARTGKRIEREAGEGFEEIGHADVPRVPPPIAPPPLEILPATLEIASMPSGMPVIIDAQPVGASPVAAKLPAGGHFILIRKEGFQDWTREIDAKAGETVSITADLKPVQETSNVITVKPAAPRQ